MMWYETFLIIIAVLILGAAILGIVLLIFGINDYFKYKNGIKKFNSFKIVVGSALCLISLIILGFILVYFIKNS